MGVSKELKKKIASNVVQTTGIKLEEALLFLESICLNLDTPVVNENEIYTKLLEKIVKSKNGTLNDFLDKKDENSNDKNDLIFL